MLNNDNIKPYSSREQKILELATIGGLTDKEAFWRVYRPKDAKVGMTSLNRKRKNRPELFAEIAKYKQDLFEAAAKAQKAAVLAAATKNALTVIEKREKLRTIIEGEADEEVVFHIAGKAIKVKKGPSLLDRIRAIDLDSRLAGHYPDRGIRHEIGDSFIDMMKELSARNGSKKQGSGEIIPAEKNGNLIDKPVSQDVAG